MACQYFFTWKKKKGTIFQFLGHHASSWSMFCFTSYRTYIAVEWVALAYQIDTQAIRFLSCFLNLNPLSCNLKCSSSLNTRCVLHHSTSWYALILYYQGTPHAAICLQWKFLGKVLGRCKFLRIWQATAEALSNHYFVHGPFKMPLDKSATMVIKCYIIPCEIWQMEMICLCINFFFEQHPVPLSLTTCIIKVCSSTQLHRGTALEVTVFMQ